MLQITARLFNNNQLIGYEITNGTQKKQLSRIDTWMYARNKQILNIVATGSEVEPSLSGINGFELKKLPRLQYISAMEKLPEMNGQDILAAGIRLILNGFIAENNASDISGRDYLQNKYKEHLKIEVQIANQNGRFGGAERLRCEAERLSLSYF